MKALKRPLLKFKFDGASIHDGRILFDDLNLFISNISLAIDRIINKMELGESIKKGRPTKASQILSALEIVSIRKGSFRCGLDLRRNGQSFPGWDLGEQAVDILTHTFGAIQKDKQLPQESDHGVMIALRDAGRIFDRGIENVFINTNTALLGSKRIRYAQPIREKIVKYINRYESGYAIAEGRLLELDTEEDRLRCRIRPSSGEPIICKYDEQITNQIIKYLRQFVQVRGEATYDSVTNKITYIHVKDIEQIGELSGLDTKISPSQSFWKAKNFDELANEQGVYPIIDLNKLTKDWPEDTDFDSFFEAVRSTRN